jgi:hypothetical protein
VCLDLDSSIKFKAVFIYHNTNTFCSTVTTTKMTKSYYGMKWQILLTATESLRVLISENFKQIWQIGFLLNGKL